MLFAPAQWLVQLVSLLPAALRPGLSIAAVVAIVWFVFAQRGIPSLWHAMCRGAARAITFIIGLVLFPEYLLTTARRARGQSPGQLTLAASEIAEHVLDGAAATYKRNEREKMVWKRFPWAWCVLSIAVCAGGWIFMDQAAPGDETRHQLAQVFEYWRSVEEWADVDPSRRAAPGDPQGVPLIRGISRHGLELSIRVHCPAQEACAGTLSARARSGAVLASQFIGLEPRATSFERLRLPRGSRHVLRGMHVIVEKA